MKISAKQYAISLYESVEDKSEAEQARVVSNFLKLLAAQGKLALAEKIVKELEALVLDKAGIVLAEVKSANKLNEATTKSLRQLIKDKTNCSEVRLTETIEPELLGGAVLKYQDKIINFSLHHFLDKMRYFLIK